MDGLEKLDHTHAIFSGFASIWQRMFLFCACGISGQFVGGNIAIGGCYAWWRLREDHGE